MVYRSSPYSAKQLMEVLLILEIYSMFQWLPYYFTMVRKVRPGRLSSYILGYSLKELLWLPSTALCSSKVVQMKSHDHLLLGKLKMCSNWRLWLGQVLHFFTTHFHEITNSINARLDEFQCWNERRLRYVTWCRKLHIFLYLHNICSSRIVRLDQLLIWVIQAITLSIMVKFCRAFTKLVRQYHEVNLW